MFVEIFQASEELLSSKCVPLASVLDTRNAKLEGTYTRREAVSTDFRLILHVILGKDEDTL